MIKLVNSEPTFIKRIVTGDETWAYEFDVQTSQYIDNSFGVEPSN